ncbi:MAG: hypothetical protein ACYC5X_17270, partial [Syntrophales bacterium]
LYLFVFLPYNGADFKETCTAAIPLLVRRSARPSSVPIGRLTTGSPECISCPRRQASDLSAPTAP